MAVHPGTEESAARAAAGSTNDLEDLLGARAGDHAAGRSLVARHGPAMVRTARRVLGRHGARDAEDVVQEAFIAALTTTSPPVGDIGAWLRSITARKAIDLLRAQTRRAEGSLPPEGESPAALARGAEAGARVEVLAVREALERLGPADRAVLVLVDLEGRSMAEAAAALGFTRVAVRLRAMRARRKLARLLRPGAGAPRTEGRLRREER
jgi:RNA polymerase sigma-70 factor (ECF subfamily)